MSDVNTWAAELRQVETNADGARKHVEVVRQQLAQSERLSGFWDDLETHLRAGNPASVLLVLRREAAQVDSVARPGSPVAALLEQIRAAADAPARASAASFGRNFPEAARRAGLQIDSMSRHPRYTFRQGFVRVEVDERELTAMLSCRDGADTLMGLDVSPLIEALIRELSRIFDRKLDEAAFSRRIYNAYVATLRTEGRPEGEEVPLRRVMHRMAKNLNRFVGDEFNADLAQLVKSGSTSIDGVRMHLNHTRNARQGILLHGLESGGYVGFISFKKEG